MNRRIMWTEAEAARLHELLAAGNTMPEIAVMIGRSLLSVESRVARDRDAAKRGRVISAAESIAPKPAPQVAPPPAGLSIQMESPQLVRPSRLPPEELRDNERYGEPRRIVIAAKTTPSIWGTGEREFRLQLLSDLHFGASATDFGVLHDELERARRFDCRVAINGDIFDGIFAKDPRFQPDVLDKELRGRNDIVNAATAVAFNYLAPYADLIDMIGDGNHERTVLRHNNIHLNNLLIEQLNRIGGKIHYGGYCGFLQYRLDAGHDLTLYYHHGAGGNSPQTRGIMEHQRLSAGLESVDGIWLGHNHWNYCIPHVKQAAGGFSEQRWIRTGAYRFHSEYDYATEKGYPAQPHGGVLLFCKIQGNGRVRIRGLV